jgi:transcriptional regulator with XRE-family HTH domain
MAGTSRNIPIADALGRALRELRLRTPPVSEVSIATVAAGLGWNPSRLSRYELGQRAPKPSDVEEIVNELVKLGLVLDANERSTLLDVARGVENPTWLAITLPEQQIQLTTLLSYEDEAAEIVDVSPLLPPGLAQTRRTAMAIIGNADVPQSEVQMRVAARMGRRDALTRENPTRLVAVINEAVLKLRIGGTDVALEQLRFMHQLGQRSNVELHVVPMESDYHSGLTGAFELLRFPDSTAVVHLETKTTGFFAHEEKDVVPYIAAAEKVLRAAMSKERSLELIAAEAKRIEETIS